MDDKDDRKNPNPGLSGWEEKLAFVIARKFERTEPEELEAELLQTILELKARPPPALRDWERYLAKALHNKADNWTRNRRAAAKREFALPEQDEETLPFSASKEQNADFRMSVARLAETLEPKLRKFLELLIEARGHRVNFARRLRIHRNTVRLWMRQIKQALIAHGFQPGAQAAEPIVRRTPPNPDESIAISSRLLRSLARNRLSGTHWRILLWVIRETARRKQKMAPFRWSGMAKELSLDRGDVCRAGQSLRRAKLVFIQNGRIGLRRNFSPFGRKKA